VIATRPRSLSLLGCSLLCLLAAPALARDVDDVPNPRTTHGGWVTDEAHVLYAAERSIEQRLETLHEQTGAEVAWVVLSSIGDSDPHTFATNLLHTWGVGRKQQDDGVVVLHVLDTRRVEIVTGYGVEAALPDVKCSWLLREVAVPAFRAGELGRGHLELSAGIDRALRSPEISHDALIAAAHAQSSDALFGTSAPRPVSRPVYEALSPENKLRWAATFLFALAIATYLVMRRIHRACHRYHAARHPAPSPLLFFPGAFMFAAGLVKAQLMPALAIFGVLILWNIGVGLRGLIRLRRFARSCPKCSRGMRLLDVVEASAALSAGARKEEELGSAEYDAWRCECGTFAIDERELPSQIQRCTGCGFRTLLRVYEKDVVKNPATASSEGELETTFECALCGLQRRETLVLPRIESKSSSSSSSDSGSSSDSSSSSASFGGGDTGGGGAGESY
jgi:uncharacterized protein